MSDFQEDEKKSDTTDVVEPIATEGMCHFCFDVLIETLSTGNRDAWQQFPLKELEAYSSDLKCPLFVTWNKEASARGGSSSSTTNKAYHLRGCIGTLQPKPLTAKTIGQYAIQSGLRDHRFKPIQFSEIRFLQCSVSLLVRYEEADSYKDWTVGVHGIIINFRDTTFNNFSATYLPEVAKEQGWSVQTAVESLIRKAGYNGRITQELLDSIKCTRYQSSKYKVSFEEYVASAKNGKDPLEGVGRAIPHGHRPGCEIC